MSSEQQRAAVAAVKGSLRAWIAILDQVYGELLRAAESIPPSLGEVDPGVDLDAMDEPTEVRSVIRNVAEDHLRQALEDLRELQVS